MSPITHLLASWTVASIPKLEKRDRAIITLAGISPDIDGLGNDSLLSCLEKRALAP